MYPHEANETDHMWLQNVSFHLHAFLLTVFFLDGHSSFLPIEFLLSLEAERRVHLLHEDFVLPPGYHFVFPRTQTSSVTLLVLVTFHLVLVVYVIPSQPRGQAPNLIILASLGSAVSGTLWFPSLVSLTDKIQVECPENGSIKIYSFN